MKKEKNLYYEKKLTFYYNVYDLNNYGLNIAEFYNLDDLTNYINKITNKQFKKDTLRVMIANNQIIADCLEVVKDNINMIDNLNTLEW